MSRKIHLLTLTASDETAALIDRELAESSVPFVNQRVASKEEYLRALRDSQPELVLAELEAGDVDGVSAFRLMKVLSVDVPFVLIVGADQEAQAIHALRAGASDFIFHDRIARLVPAVRFQVETDRLRREKRETERLLRAEQDRLRRINENMLDLVSQVDMNLRYVYVSASHQRLCGLSASSLERRPFLDLVHADDRLRVESLARTQWLQRKSASTTLRFQSADGSSLWLEVVGSPLLDDAGVQSGVVLASRDITDRMKQDEEARRQEAYLTFLSDSAMTFVDFPPEGDIHAFIAERTRLLLGDVIVLTSAYDRQAKALVCRGLAGAGRFVESFLKFVGHSPVGRAYPVDPAAADALRRGQLAEVEGGVSELSFGGFPRVLGSALEMLLGVRRVYAIGITQHGELMGSVAIIARRPSLEAERVAVEAFAYQAAVALHRRQTEQALKDSEARFRAILNAVPDLMFIQDADGVFLDYHAPADAVLYRKPEDFLGRNIRDVVPPGMAAIAEEHLHTCLATGSPVTYEYTLPFEERVRAFEARLEPLGNDRVLSIVRDVTEEHRSREALRDSEQRFRELTDLLPQPVFEIAPDGHLMFANRSCFEVFGYRPEDLRADTTIANMLAPQDRERGAQFIAAVLAGAPSHGREYQGLRKDGSTFPMLIYSAAVIRDSQPVGLRGIIVDVTDRKLGERRLEESTERYRIISSLTSDYVYSCVREITGSYIVDWMSGAFEQITGYSWDEIKQHGCWLFVVHPDDRPRIRELLHSLRPGDEGSAEYRILTRSGAERWVRDSSRCVAAEGDPGRYILYGAAQDVTERRQAAEAIAASEIRYRMLFNTINDAVFVHEMTEDGMPGRFLEVNDVACRRLGYSRDELLQMTPLQIDAPEGIRVVAEAMRALRKNGQHLWEGMHRTKDGRAIPVEISNVLFQYGGREVILSTARDMTARKQAEEDLRASELRFRGLFEQAAVGICFTDAEGRFLDVNERMAAFLDIPRERLLRMRYQDVTYPEDLPANVRLRERLANGEIQSFTLEKRFLRADGSTIWGNLTLSLLRGADGRPIHYVAIVQDISDKKKAEDSLRESEKSYRGLFDAVTEAIYIQDREGRFIDVNEGAVQMYGYTREEIVGRTPDFLSADGKNDPVRLRLQLERAFAGEPQRFEWWGRRKDGQVFAKEVLLNRGWYSGREAVIATARDISERKRQDDALRASEQLTRAIVKHGPVGIAVFDREMRFIMVSDRFLEENNLREEEVLGRTHYEVFPWLPEGWKHSHQRCLNGAVEGIPEEPFARADGSIGYSDWECRPWYSADGEIGGVVLYAEDITARKKAEEDIRKLSRAVEQSPSSIIITDKAGNIEYVNPTFTRNTGYTFEEARGKNPRILKSGLTSPEEYRILWETVTTGRTWTGEFLNRRKNGELFFEAAAILPILDPSGSISHFLAVKEDITARKRMEQHLRESEERYRMFFNEDLAGAFIARPDGAFVACNPAFARIFGYASTDAAQQANLFDLFPDLQYREALIKKLRQHRQVEYQKLNGRRRDGKLLYLIQSVSGSFSERGDLTEIKGYVIDNTEEHQAEDQLRQAQKMESLGALAGGIAHDFNNILNNVLGFAGQLKKYATDTAKVQRYADTIEKSAMRGADLAMHLLTATRHRKAESVPTDLLPVLAELEQVVHETFPTSVSFEHRVDTDLLPIKGDRGSLYQVLLNLCVNARDAMPEGGRLIVEARNRTVGADVNPKLLRTEATQCVELRVTDTGTGIPPEIREKIFEPFFTTKEKGKGTGLGLAIVYNVVRDHGGSISVDSVAGTGTTFTIILPAIQAQAPSEASDVPAPHRGGNQLILLVDDEEPMQELGKELLEEIGYRVILASDGLQAVQAYREHADEVALVILDLIMPKLDGGQTYVELKKIRPDVKAIFCSGFTSEKVITDLLKDEGLRAIQKPFHPADFIRVIQEVLAG